MDRRMKARSAQFEFRGSWLALWRGVLPIVLTALLVSPLRAQTWDGSVELTDEGYYRATSYVDPGLWVTCGGVMPGHVLPERPENEDLTFSRAGHVVLTLADAAIGAPTGAVTRSDVMIVIGTLGYRLPSIQLNELHGSQEQILDMNDGLLAAMAAGGPAEIRTDGGMRVPLSLHGAQERLTILINHCRDGEIGAFDHL